MADLGLGGLVTALVKHGLIDESEALTEARQAGDSCLITALVERKKVDPAKAASLAARQFHVPVLDLSAYDSDFLLKDLIDQKIVLKHQVIALSKKAGNRVVVAMADPSDSKVIDAIRFQTSLTVLPVVARADQLSAMIRKSFESVSAALQDFTAEDLQVEFSDDPAPSDESFQPDVDDAPVVKFIQKMLVDAITEGASDIHFEPYEKAYRIRFRVDGELREIAQPPVTLKDKLASRIKVISRLNIAEKRVPQDGRMKINLSRNKAIDFRVSTLPCLDGEKIVLRILDPASASLGIDALGYEPEQRVALLDAINRPYGMVLVTGPTGSGKTVSLYTCLNLLNKPGVNISTAEDPAEIRLYGINQVNVDEKTGLTFASALKAFLRQDPDVIMVGEIRDLETGEIAVKAAQTGHLVLSTLHTNDAPQTLTRLMNMGVPAFNIASSVLCITAQRLVRKLCPHCKEPIEVPEHALREAGFTDEDIAKPDFQLYGHKGCDYCKGVGYKGRVGVYQVMPITEAIQEIILNGGNAMQIAAQARAEGVNDLRRSGLIKAMAGVTSLDEILAATNV